MFLKKVLLLKIFLLLALIPGGCSEKKEPFEEHYHQSLRSRQRLHSLYTSIPLSSTIDEKFLEFVVHLNVSMFPEKIFEYDTLGFMNGPRQTIYHKLPYLIANPAFRTPHVSKEWCESREFFKLGFRVYQTTHELGLPTQIKCAACHPLIEGLNNLYYLFPERDFTQELIKLPIDSRKLQNHVDYCEKSDCEQNPRVAEFLEYLVENDLYFGKVTRWSGEHTTTAVGREIMDTPNGELAIHSRQPMGFTTMCGMELNGKVVSSNVFVNSDVVVPDRKENDTVFTYGDYETITITTPVTDEKLNLELFVSWDAWGCCSACCCPAIICGHDHQTSSNCDSLFSSRSRVGHLSIRKFDEGIDPNKPLPQFLIEFRKLLSIPPYTHKGIPLFSTLLMSSTHLKQVVEKVKTEMMPKLLKANKADGYRFSSGMFIESESCKSHVQKTDCFEWARCHGIPLNEETMNSSETVSDSCHQVHFVDVLVGTDNKKVVVGEHENLRIRIDSEVHDMKTINAKWRVNLRKPKKYDASRPCLVQGIVQRGNEILILNFATWNLKIDLILDNERKIRITFVNARAHETQQVMQYTIFYWALAIVFFFLLLIAGIVFMHREKSKRLERAIKSVAATARDEETTIIHK
ncbi:unnamed protein product [Caenorhabditis brenneri]